MARGYSPFRSSRSSAARRSAARKAAAPATPRRAGKARAARHAGRAHEMARDRPASPRAIGPVSACSSGRRAIAAAPGQRRERLARGIVQARERRGRGGGGVERDDVVAREHGRRVVTRAIDTLEPSGARRTRHRSFATGPSAPSPSMPPRCHGGARARRSARETIARDASNRAARRQRAPVEHVQIERAAAMHDACPGRQGKPAPSGASAASGTASSDDGTARDQRCRFDCARVRQALGQFRGSRRFATRDGPDCMAGMGASARARLVPSRPAPNTPTSAVFNWFEMWHSPLRKYFYRKTVATRRARPIPCLLPAFVPR